jgi:hypothetical protein
MSSILVLDIFIGEKDVSEDSFSGEISSLSFGEQ